MTVDPKPQSRFWLITSPRTASNMLVKILNLDAQGVRPAHHGGYFWMPAIPMRFGMHAKAMTEWTEEENAALNKIQQDCFDNLQDYLEAAEKENQVVFVKEHALFMNHPFYEALYSYGGRGTKGTPELLKVRGLEKGTRSVFNKTSLPDEFLKTIKPTFLIRHPAMMFPSLYRTTLNDIEVDGFKRPNKEPNVAETTMQWIRYMYNFYEQQYAGEGQFPIVLDADDVMKQPELVAKFAKLAGLDSEKLTFSWEKASEEKLSKLNEIEKRMLSSINASTKVDHSKLAGDIDIDAEAVKWKAEFGEEGGYKLECWVRNAMPDYEYMHSKRLTLD